MNTTAVDTGQPGRYLGRFRKECQDSSGLAAAGEAQAAPPALAPALRGGGMALTATEASDALSQSEHRYATLLTLHVRCRRASLASVQHATRA
jgi:hypothetical protein